MADHTTNNGVTGTHSSNTSSDAPQLGTNIESGNFNNEKSGHQNIDNGATTGTEKPIDEDEDEDMDALIDELESQDGHVEEEEEEEQGPGAGRVIPEDQLQTDTRVGLTEQEVLSRRKKYGLNQMKEEKENLILKFLGFFVGPIQFVMEVCRKARFVSHRQAFCVLFHDNAISAPFGRSWAASLSPGILGRYHSETNLLRTSWSLS